MIPSLLSESKKWDTYIQDYAEDKELVEIAQAAKYISEEVARRRQKEYLERRKQSSGIWRHYNKN